MKHIMNILMPVFSLGYHGKTVDFEKYSPCHRTTAAHFLNKGKSKSFYTIGELKANRVLYPLRHKAENQ
jgi:hypothetical protein